MLRFRALCQIGLILKNGSSSSSEKGRESELFIMKTINMVADLVRGVFLMKGIRS